jgi:hypothetical protein
MLNLFCELLKLVARKKKLITNDCFAKPKGIASEA